MTAYPDIDCSSYISRQIARAEGALKNWRAKFDADAPDAMDWAEPAFKAAAQLNVWEICASFMPDDPAEFDPEAMIRMARAQFKHLSARDFNRTSSVASNLLQDYKRIAWFEAMQMLAGTLGLKHGLEDSP
jgi:hypothetical protein